MKNYIISCFLLFSSLATFSQIGGSSSYDPLPNELPVDVELNISNRDTNGCIEEGSVDFYFDNLLKYSKLNTTGDYYYSFKYELISIGTINSSNEEIFLSYFISPSEYTRIENGKYIYSFDIMNSNIDQLNQGLLGYGLRLKVIKNYYSPSSFGNSYLPFVPTTSRYKGYHYVCNGSNGGSGTNKPNLTLKKFEVRIGTTMIYKAYPEGQTPIIQSNKWNKFIIEIENKGHVPANSSDVSVLVSKDLNSYPIPNGSQVYNFINTDYGTISNGSSRSLTFEHFIGNNILGLNFEENKDYYMFIDIDPNQNVDESLENDNFSITRFRWNDATNDRYAYINFGGTENIEILLDYSDNTLTNLYNVKAYSLNLGGTIVYDNNLTPDTIVDLSYLPSGVYAIHVNNNYLKKLLKTTPGSGLIKK